MLEPSQPFPKIRTLPQSPPHPTHATPATQQNATFDLGPLQALAGSSGFKSQDFRDNTKFYLYNFCSA